MIIAKKIHKYYGDLHVLKSVDLHIKKSEIVSIVGASGAGKTTLLQILGTLDKPTKKKNSELEINGTNIYGLKSRELSKFRNKHIGFIFQFHQLLPEFTALENICIPAFIHKTPRKEAEKRAMELLNFLNLENRASHKPGELSGGEQQMLAMSRALMARPKVLLLDEPSMGLAPLVIKQIFQIIKKINSENDTTIFLVEQNANQALQIADRGYVIENGKITMTGSADSLLTNPDIQKAYLGI